MPAHPSGSGEPSEGVGQGEPARQQRATGDCALAADIPDGEEIVDRGDAACCDHGDASRNDRPKQLEVGAASEPSRAVLVTSKRETPAAAQSSASSAGVVPERRVQPSTATVAVADVDCDDQMLAEPLDGIAEESGRERGGSHHHAVGPSSDGGLDRVDRAVAAADLKREAPCGGDPFDEPERGHAAERAVEVHHVKPPRAVHPEVPSELDRVSTLDRHRLAPALREANDAPFEHVDGRDHIELLC